MIERKGPSSVAFSRFFSFNIEERDTLVFNWFSVNRLAFAFRLRAYSIFYQELIDHYFNLVDPASSHMLVLKIKPCMSKYKLLYGETANGSLKQL